tara:strand:- start:146 stop:643 length:498 start_codon:yes stop_codon:yes gene_type:complete
MIKFSEIKDIHPEGSIWLGENRNKNDKTLLHNQALSFHENFLDVAKDVFTEDKRFADVTEHDWMQPLFDKLMKLLEDVGFGKYYVVQADLNKATDVPSHYRMLYIPCCSPDCIDLDIQTGEKGIFKLPLKEGSFIVMPPNSGIRIIAPPGKMFLGLIMGICKDDE